MTHSSIAQSIVRATDFRGTALQMATITLYLYRMLLRTTKLIEKSTE